MNLGIVGSHSNISMAPTRSYSSIEEDYEEDYFVTSTPPRIPPRVYGCRSEPTASHVCSVGPIQLELFRGFTAVPGMRSVGARCTLTKQCEVPRDTIFVIHLFVDVSGSMDGTLSDSRTTRLDII